MYGDHLKERNPRKYSKIQKEEDYMINRGENAQEKWMVLCLRCPKKLKPYEDYAYHVRTEHWKRYIVKSRQSKERKQDKKTI